MKDLFNTPYQTLSAKEICDTLRINKTTLNKWTKAGLLTRIYANKQGGHYLKSEVIKYLENLNPSVV